MEKSKSIKDTFEIDKYIERKEKITSFFSCNNIENVTKKELANILSVPEEDISKLSNILSKLEEEGIIVSTRKWQKQKI